MINRIKHFVTFLMSIGMFLAGCSGCGVKHAVPPANVPQDEAPVEAQPPQMHSSAWTEVPEAPEGDDFYKTIQFPTTPPHRPGGHYINPPKNPFEIPDFVKKYPDHFKIDDAGFWHVDFPPEKAKKLEMFSGGEELTEEEYDKQIANIAREGLDTFTSAIVIAHLPGANSLTNILYNQAYEENPDDLYIALSYYTGLEINGKREEAEAGYRRLVDMYPDSTKALYRLANFISIKADSSDAHRREAIPYFEKLYRENPFWFVPIYKLGIIYYGLEEYEKARAYFRASEVFTGPMDGTSFFLHLIREQPSIKQNKE